MTDHEWFIDRIAEQLAGGLPEVEQVRFERHLASCADCAAEYTAARQMEKTMTQLFAPIAPAGDFEDRLIARLRSRAPRLRISPVIRRAAIAACAAIALGGMGFVMSQRIENGTLPMWSIARGPKVASNLRQIGLSLSQYSADVSQEYYMGGHVQRVDVSSSADRRIVLHDAEKQPVSSTPASIAPSYEVNGVVSGKVSNFPQSQLADARGDHTIQFGDESARFQQNPFQGVAHDMIFAKKQNSAETPAGQVASSSGVSSAYNFYGATGQHVSNSSSPYFQPGHFNADDPVLMPSDTDLDGVKDGPKLEAVARAPAQAAQDQSGSNALGNDAKQQQVAANPSQVLIGKNFLLPQRNAALKIDRNGLAEQLAMAQQDAPSAPAPSQSSPDQPSSDQSPPSTQPTSPKVIRNGEMEFEVESFDSAHVTISKIVAEEGGVVATVNSEKLTNGKVKGVVTIRVAPDHLDTLVLKLRALGDLKRQNLTADDVTKQYTDTTSELRAARAMEERLLSIIKTSQGQVKDLLAVEKELATWREKIEKAEGEIRYYDNLVAMSTLNISISERDIKTAAAATESEDVDMGVEADDVEVARSNAIKTIEDAKGRITESELKKLDAGQLAAKIVADIKPEAAGPVIDRLKQLGRVARLEASRRQIIAPGATPDSTTKLEQGDTHLVLSLYNVANIAPRQTTILNLAGDDVEQTYQAILARIAKSGGRIVTSNLNRQTDQQTGGTIQCEVKAADADAVIGDIRGLGEVVRLNAVENPDTNNVTNAKRGINIELTSLAAMLPREVNNRAIASADVSQSHRAMLDMLRTIKSRIVASKLEDTGDGKLNGYLDFEVRRADVPAIEKAIAGAGETYDRRVDTSAAADNVTDAKVQFKMQIVQATALPPRQTDTLGIEVSDVDSASQGIQGDATSMGGRILDSSSSKDANAQTAKLVLEVPLSHAGEILAKARQLGVVRTNQQSSNAQAPAGELGRERLELTLASGEALVAPDQGILASIRHGFVISFAGLMWSLQLIVIGLCFVVPWALLIWIGMRLVKRRKPVAS